MTPDEPTIEPIRKRLVLRIVFTLLGVCIGLVTLFSLILILLSRPPQNFPINTSLTIEAGTSVSEIVGQFADAGYVRSELVLYAYLLFFHDTKDIRAGTYVFESPLGARELANHITLVGPQDTLLSLTFPEGITVLAMSRIAKENLPLFDQDSFLSYAREKEGYLFPDTYYVPETFTDSELFDLLQTTFDEKITPLLPAISEHALTEEGVIILASIIEREANTIESMKRVSSVLQNRLALGMPLQADASIEYILDKSLSELTPEDLEIESPYNTYLNKGLPPTPIGNPGLDSINAVLEPEETDYFYYITDADGNFHYAKTFDEHRANIARYLR